MTLLVHTARMGYRGEDWLDVTLAGNERRQFEGDKGGHKGIGLSFAPSDQLLRSFLRKRNDGTDTEADWATYTAKYSDEMRTSYRNNREAWDKLLSWDHVVLLCFCSDPTRCHRRLLAGILVKFGAQDVGEVVPEPPAQQSLLLEEPETT